MGSINLQDVHDTLVSVAFEAGRMIMAANPNDISQGTKMNSVDIVTETDKAVEKMVSTRLRSAYPDFLFVGEETYVPGQTEVTDAPTFVVDPIDGTTNFVHGFPHACISLGFVLDRKASVGVVFNPFLDVLYSGVRGRGSFMQRNALLAASNPELPAAVVAPRLRLPLGGTGDPPSAPPLGGLDSSLVGVEWGSSRDGANFELKARVFRLLAASARADGGGGRMCHSLRSYGSAALNICAVAAGQLDAYWEGGCWAWDVAAGWCILEEAGGIMVGGNPGEWDAQVDSRVYLGVRGAAEEGQQRALVEEFWGVMGGERLDYPH